jgi:hypothetical protein
MPESPPTWVRKNACQTDLGGGQCLADDEMLTHHTSQRDRYNDAPRPEVMEVELSMMRGELTVAEACMRRNGGRPAHPSDVERAGVRYTTAGDLRSAGFAVIHTCGRKGEGYGHVSVVWPAANPLDEADPAWPPHVQEAFAACFTGDKG